MSERLITAEGSQEDEVVENSIRPQRLADYVGQPAVREQMEIFIGAARERGEALDHVLIFGPAGPGQDHPVTHHRPRTGREPAPQLRSRAGAPR
jgi:holliday junction DNA helicase RuvB